MSEQVMTLLATRVGGTVRRVDLSSDGNSCEVGFVDEADAVKFHLGLNEVPISLNFFVPNLQFFVIS
jgi:hypothetical protein